jgi:hypothetical protein
MAEEPVDLPPLRAAVLGRDELGRLLADLAEHARIARITVKGGPPAAAGPAEPALADVMAIVCGPGARSVQIRYSFDACLWCDTLMPCDEGVRLVRIQINE